MRECKLCVKCNENKHRGKFGQNKRAKDNLKSWCQSCENNEARAYYKTKNGLTSKIYGNQKRHSRERGHLPPSYTLNQLREWAFSQKVFHTLYDNWISSGCHKNLIPSFDRKDDYKPYILDNLQIVTWEENNTRGILDRINGVNTKKLKAVIGTCKTTGGVINFDSMKVASNIQGISQGNISECCSDKRKSAGGFIWRYKKD